jgi:AmpD protein
MLAEYKLLFLLTRFSIMLINKNTGLLDSARQVPSPNHNERPQPDDMSLIVIHNITLPPNEFGTPWIDALFTNQLPADEHPFFAEICHLRVSSHLLIRRTGEIVQYVPFHLRAWHAGISSYQGRDVCNDFSVGIEMEGTDDQAFTEAQYVQLEYVIEQLLKTYPSLQSQHITGHEHIAPVRKTDPGACFDWHRLANKFAEKLPANAD